jgi:hypothetical protein
VECPFHDGRFEARSGKAVMLPATEDIATFAVRIEGDAMASWQGRSAGICRCWWTQCRGRRPILQHAPKDTLKHTVYNLGSGRETTQGEVAAVVQQVVPRAQTPLQSGKPPHQKPHPYMDNASSTAVLGAGCGIRSGHAPNHHAH